MFLKQKKSYLMIKEINNFFERRIRQQRIYRFGEYSKIRTAITEEPLKLVHYLLGKKAGYEPIVISRCMVGQ